MPNNASVDAFIFDLGKVIVDWNPRYLLHQIIPNQEQLDFLIETVLDLDWLQIVDAGYPLSKAIAERSEIYPKHAEALQIYIERWPETIHGFFEGTLDIVRKLHADQRSLYILSNWAKETWDRVESDFTFLRYFDDKIISGHVGIAKPDPAIFKLAQAQFQVDPGTTLFIDDNEKNIIAARDLGFKVLLFKTPEKLASDLVDVGINLT